MPVLDPYHVLGLAPGAPLAEVKRAYRRLAKIYHPDSAGERAVKRFLELQAAYEMLLTGRGLFGRPRPRTEPRQPAASEAARTRARESSRARSGGRTPGGSPGATTPGSGSAPGAGTSHGPRTSGRAGSGRGETRRAATPGSTSYDDAPGEAFDPAWDGATWYGPSSGTYWTLNPKEYADPRKHGPEYQERARRASRTSDPDGEPIAAGWTAGQRPVTDAGPSPRWSGTWSFEQEPHPPPASAQSARAPVLPVAVLGRLLGALARLLGLEGSWR